MTFIPSNIVSNIADLGFEAGKKHIKQKYDEKKLKECLSSYISRQEKFYELCSPEEEIDFQGLINYIQNDLINDVITRIFDNNPIKRSRARKSIIDKAIAKSCALTPESKSRVANNIAACLDIIKSFYKKKIDTKYYILAKETIDSINEHTDETISKAVEDIKKFEMSSLDSRSIALQLSNQELPAGNKIIKSYLNQISESHPLYPYYGYRLEDDHLISKPLIPEAASRYPTQYRFTGPIRIGDKHITDPTFNVLDYAYRHQLHLVMKVEEAQKYLGNMLDPMQDEAEDYIGKEFHAIPPKFPPAFPCSIKVNNEVFFEYILLRAQEITDDGILILGNKEQTHTHFRFEIRVDHKAFIQKDNISKSKKDIGFTVSLSEASNTELLKYTRFIKAMIEEHDFRIHVLENDQDLIAGYINESNHDTGFSSIDEEIDFLERICSIEKYFNLTFHINGVIPKQEYESVLLISELIKNEIIETTWTKVTFTGIINDDLLEELKNAGANIGDIAYVEVSSIELFGTTIELKIFKTLYDAIIEDYDRILKIIQLSKSGDPYKISFIAGDNNIETCTLNIPENVTSEGEVIHEGYPI